MRKQTLLVLVGAMCCGTSVMAAAVALEDRPLSGSKQTDARSAPDVAAPSEEAAIVDYSAQPGVPPDMVVFPIDADMKFEHVVVGADGVATVVGEGATAGIDERMIYSNTMGISVAGFPTNGLVADDIGTTAPVGCNLTSYRFKVMGRVNPAGTGGAYTVKYSLYNNCPQAVTSTQRTKYTDEGGIKLRGSDGQVTFPDEGPRMVEHVVAFPAVVELPTNVWLGIQFTRTNCGAILGAPAMIGHSADNWDFPGLVCNGNLGGFPNQPHASYWLEMFGSANCSESYLAYRAAKASSAAFSAGGNIQFLDDINLTVNNCQMSGYEVAVKGQGFYQFELVRDCGGGAPESGIPGTYRTFIVNLSTQPQLQLARFTFDPPIPLNSSSVFFRFTVNNATAGVIMAGIQPSLGFSTESYYLLNDQGGCTPEEPGAPLSGVFHASITCAGSPALGACCDPYLTECSGTDVGKRCVTDADCTAPGTCDAICRHIPKSNCPFPPGGQDLDPKWISGRQCAPDPFTPLGQPCGVASCCRIRIGSQGQEQEVCENMTRTGCATAEPLERPRLWQLGQYCGSGAQVCPRNACLAREGSCGTPHLTPGCSDPYCCTTVCTTHGVDGAFCCSLEWDSVCVDFAQNDCNAAPGNDHCAPDSRGLDGALNIPVPGAVATDNRLATVTTDEPGFCCHTGVGVCLGGPLEGEPCVANSDCPQSSCTELTPSPGAQGFGIVWFKFTQPNGFTSALIAACTSNSPALDGILQVYKAGDFSSQLAACNSLTPIACNDDSSGCSSSSRNPRVCVQNLVPGQTYYISLAAKTPDRQGQYRVAVSAGCNPSPNVAVNDWCPNATTVSDGQTSFFINVDTCVGGTNAGKPCDEPADCPNGTCPSTPNHQVTFDCPAASCSPDARNDLWYNYTATCTGRARFETCGPTSDQTPDSNLAIYEDCTKCPPVSGNDIGCSTDAFAGCGLGSRVEATVEQGQCYKVRVADNAGFPISGKLTIECRGSDCDGNGIDDDCDISCAGQGGACNVPGCGTKADCNSNGLPDNCDITANPGSDCNASGVPDECELTTTTDCQPNGILDSCDIANCTGQAFCVDVSPQDGRPDVCPAPSNCAGGFTAVSVPANCAIDARQPHAPGSPGTLQNWNSLQMTFDPGCNLGGLGGASFTVACTPPIGTCPTVTGLSGILGQTATINLSTVIPAGSWTCITHTESGEKICLGSLPGDANSDRTSAPVDILSIIDNLNGVVLPPLQPHQCDLDRSAVCNPADILSEIDLLNGATGFLVWNGKNLPVCPNP